MITLLSKCEKNCASSIFTALMTPIFSLLTGWGQFYFFLPLLSNGRSSCAYVEGSGKVDITCIIVPGHWGELQISNAWTLLPRSIIHSKASIMIIGERKEPRPTYLKSFLQPYVLNNLSCSFFINFEWTVVELQSDPRVARSVEIFECFPYVKKWSSSMAKSATR